MDPVTHMLVGAAVGQAVAGRELGFARAALWGAVAAELPDIDVIVSTLAADDPFDMLVHHRGVTHALWFGPVAGTLGGLLLSQSEIEPRAGVRNWILLLSLALLSHPLLDWCTHYGTQLLLPFSDERFALPALPIIEPVFTAIVAFGVAAAAWLARRRPQQARLSGVVALLAAVAYMLYGLRLNGAAIDYARQDLAARGAGVAIVYAFPTLLQLHYRRVVARTENEDWVGFVSMARPCPIVWDHRPRNDAPVVDALKSSRQGRIFEWFATGLTAAYFDHRRVFLTDLRYGLATEVLRGNWRLEADLGGSPVALGTPRFVQSPRPQPTIANVRQLFQEAYPESCDERAGRLDL